MEKLKNMNINVYIKILFIIACLFFAVPSIIYFIKQGTVLNFNDYFKFLLNDDDKIKQTLIYLLILMIMTGLYLYIVKNRKKLFRTNKQIFMYIAIIALIFIMVLPFTCSDVFYYLGIGRIDNTYAQNPYYVTIKDFVEQGEQQTLLGQDTVLAQGYINDWAGSTVVYGPIWTLICNIVAGLSFGNIDIGLLVFKLFNVIVHILNCYLIYKISNKKIFVLLYGLNPFVLIEGIACVHNDMFVVLFILLTLYMILKKRNLLLGLVFLALATTIKYFPILLLPFILVYYFRKEKRLKRFGLCVGYGLVFLVLVAIPYVLYVRDFDVLAGLFTQQEKLAKNFYILLKEYFGNIPNLIENVKKVFMCAFVAMYVIINSILLTKKEIKFHKQMRIYQWFLMAFLFLLITNFQPWYILWLFPCMMWQKSDNIKLIIRNILN